MIDRAGGYGIRGDGSPAESRPPSFVVGCPRAGTTLVSQLFDSHPALAVYHETVAPVRGSLTCLWD